MFNDHEIRFQLSACPNGKRIVYGTAHNSIVELWSSDVDGTNAVKITDKPVLGEGGACTPDSKSVVFAAENAVWRAPTAGGAAEKTDLPLAQSGASLDGKLLFHVAERVENGTMHSRFVITPANDLKNVLHTFDVPYGTQLARFTPDGKAIAFLLNRNRATNIWEIPFASNTPVSVTKFPSGDMFAFSWSWDGKQLAFSRGQRKTDVILMKDFR